MDVNKQLLDALKQLVRVVKLQHPWGASINKAEKAIAAAEQAQQAEPAWLAELRKEVGYKKGTSGYDSGANADSVAKLLEMLDGKQQAEPVAWVRFCSDGCYEGPIMNSDSRMDNVRRTSGAWTPLYAAQPPAVAVPDGWHAAMSFARSALAEAIHIAPLDRLPRMAGAAMQQIDALLADATKP